MRYYEVQKNLIKTDHLYAPYIFVFNNDFWKSLKPEHQKIIQEGAEI